VGGSIAAAALAARASTYSSSGHWRAV